MATRKKHYPPLSEHRYAVHELPSNTYLVKAEFNWGSYFPFIGPSGIAYAPRKPVRTVGGPPATFFASRDWATTLWRDVPEDEDEQATMLLNEAMEQGGSALLLTFASGWKCYCEDTAHKIAQYLWKRGLVLQGSTATRGGITGLSPLQGKQLLALVDAVPPVLWHGFEVRGARFDEESWWIPDAAREESELDTIENEVYADATDSELMSSVGPGTFHVVTQVDQWASRERINGTVVRLEERDDGEGRENWIVRDVEWEPRLPATRTEHFTKKQAQSLYNNGSWYAQSDIPRPVTPPHSVQLIKMLRDSGNADDAKTAEKLYHLVTDEAWDEALDIAQDGFNDMNDFVANSGDGEPLYVAWRADSRTREAPVYDYAGTPGEDEDLNR